jgi:hypothetical protein
LNTETRSVLIKNLFLVILFSALCIPQLYSQEGDRVITSIEITGLTRTKLHIAQYPLEKFIGRDGSTLNFNEVEAAVKDIGTLELQSIGLVESEDGIMLHVTVTEKWSIFPVPIFTFIFGHISAGFFFADTNAFGIGDLMAFGGIYNKLSWIGVAL